MLLMRASRGARGNAATNMVVKLNWTTRGDRQSDSNMALENLALTGDFGQS